MDETPMISNPAYADITAELIARNAYMRHRFNLGRHRFDDGHPFRESEGLPSCAGWLYAQEHAIEAT